MTTKTWTAAYAASLQTTSRSALASLISVSRSLRMLGLLLVALLVACSSTETPGGQPAPALGSQKQAATVGLDESYVVFALDGAWVKHHTKIHSGNIGADKGNFAGPFVRGGVDIKVGHHVSAGDATIFANRLEVGKTTTIGKAYYKDGLDLGTATTITESEQVSDAYFPLFPVKPEMPAVIPGTGQDITVGWWQHRTLTPGTYGDIRVTARGKLTFEPGEYHIRAFHAGSHASLTFGAGEYHFQDFYAGHSTEALFGGETTFVVADRFLVRHHARFNPAKKSNVAPTLIRVYVNGTDGALTHRFPAKPRAVHIDAYSEFRANVMAWNGTIHILHHTQAVGSFFAKRVVVGHHVQLTNRNGLVGSASGQAPVDAEDVDNDSVLNTDDNCLTVPNLDQADGDGDGIGDACDNCVQQFNPEQRDDDADDENTDGLGNACSTGPYCGDAVVNNDPVSDLDFIEECDEGSRNGPDGDCTDGCDRAPEPKPFASLRTVDTIFLKDGPQTHHVRYPSFARVKDPFAEDPTAFGLVEGVDTVVKLGPHLKAKPRRGRESIRYRQHYRGVAVHGRELTVVRSKATKYVSDVYGLLARGIQLDSVVPSVAYNVAKSTAEDLTLYGTIGNGELRVAPVGTSTSPSWALAWVFDIHGADGSSSSMIGISGTTGELMFRPADEKTCTTGAVAADSEPTAINVAMPEYAVFNDGTDAIALKRASDPGVFGLAQTFGALTENERSEALANGDKNVLYARCQHLNYPDVAAVASPNVTAMLGSRTESLMAASYMAAQRCLKFVQDEYEYQDKVTTEFHDWYGWDGKGKTPIVLEEHPSRGPLYRQSDKRIYINTAWVAEHGPSVEMVCHEFAHGLWFAFLKDDGSNEVSSVNEGWGDIFGDTVELMNRPDSTNSRFGCFLGDREYNASCARDFGRPEDSAVIKYPKPGASGNPVSRKCWSKDASSATIYSECPSKYNGENYCTYQDSCKLTGSVGPCCDEHATALPFDHWFYLLAAGGSDTDKVACTPDIKPLDPDLRISARMALGLVFEAITSGVLPDLPGYADFAAATLSIARERHGEAVAEQVQNAWYAVNVLSQPARGLPPASEPPVAANGHALVFPPRGAEKVSPWVYFSALDVDFESEWDFQVFEQPASGGEMKLIDEKTGVAARYRNELEDDTYDAAFGLALPANSSLRYLWRVKPSSEVSWECQPLNWFDGTGDVPAVDMTTLGMPNGGKAGRLYIQWTHAEGAWAYEAYARKVDPSAAGAGPNCTAGSGVQEADFFHVANNPARQDDYEAYRSADGGAGSRAAWVPFPAMQAHTQYWIDMRAVGPLDAEGNRPYGPCTRGEIQVVGPEPPVLDNYCSPATCSYPPGTLSWKYSWLPEKAIEFDPEWRAWGEGKGSRVRMVPRTNSGACATDSMLEEWGTDDGGYDYLGRHYSYDDDSVIVRNGMGYCLDVVDVSDYGYETWSMGKWPFRMSASAVVGLTPGGRLGTSGEREHPFLTPSAGEKTRLQWDAVAGTSGYGVVVGEFPPRLDWNARPNNSYGPSFAFDGKVFDWEVTTSQLDQDPLEAGRYCWTVWPIFADQMGQPSIGQPVVAIPNPHCFVVVKPPKITTPPGKVDVSTNAVIKGKVKFPYIPSTATSGGRWRLSVSEVGEEVDCNEAGSTCQVTWDPNDACSNPKESCYNVDWSCALDRFDCEYDFELTGLNPGSTYEVRAEIRNGQEVVTEAVEVIEVECGKLGQGCCPSNVCSEGVCASDPQGNVCKTECGGTDQSCCAPAGGEGYPSCHDAGTTCRDNTWEEGASESAGQHVRDMCFTCGSGYDDCCLGEVGGEPAGVCDAGWTCGDPGVRPNDRYGWSLHGPCRPDDDDDDGGGGSPECGGVQLIEGNGVFDGDWRVEFGDRAPYGKVEIAVANEEGACIQYIVRHQGRVILETGRVEWSVGAPSFGNWRVIAAGGGASGGFKRWETDLEVGLTGEPWLDVTVYRCGVGKEWAAIEFNKACSFSMTTL